MKGDKRGGGVPPEVGFDAEGARVQEPRKLWEGRGGGIESEHRAFRVFHGSDGEGRR